MTYQRQVHRDPSGSASVREIAVTPAGPARIELRLLASGGQLLVTGPDIPWVSVQRIESDRARHQREKAEAAALARGWPTAYERSGSGRFKFWASQPDLFSRRAAAVSMTVAGDQAELRPGGGHMMLSSFDVRAQVNDRSYELSQSGRRTAQVLRDGRLLARLRRSASYRNGPRYDGDLAWEAGTDPLDVAMTHALASAYRVGANGFFLNLLRWTGVLGLAVASGG